MQRRTLLKAAGLSTLAPLGSAWAADAPYPSSVITLICPYGAGGNSDLRSRQIARFMAAALKQNILVDNKAGAGGNIGTEMVSRAKPDGYTIGMGNFAPLSVNPTLFRNLRFNPAKDLMPICLIEKGPLVLMVKPDSPYRSVADIIAAAKRDPAKLSFASGGIGGSHHLSGETLKSIAKINLTHVPYKSGLAATVDLMGGSVDMMFEQMYAAAPNIRAKKLRALAITSKTRSPLFPEIPTMIEAGVPGFEVQNWQGLVAPANTPEAIVKLLNETCNAALKDPAIREQMLSQGNEIGGGTPEQFAVLIKEEAARWGKLVREADIKAE